MVPDVWKTALIIKLLKKGDLNLCNNWRGIALLSIYDPYMNHIIIIHFIYHFIVDSFLTGTLEPTNDQLPTSVASYARIIALLDYYYHYYYLFFNFIYFD